MEYTNLGKTGLKVSRICLGCMSFGDSEIRKWSLTEEEVNKLEENYIQHSVVGFS